ncbi:MAG: histidine triad nucleotide-binding protein [Fervidobacterium sp.]|uniref:Histidine triad (HIT) family protein n=1 Tax=Fervidobacterium gondwanense DSM 13020 TaxID=1121883 RepID=A0A1M7TEY9_FERGO|nr:histidine triad nucleotide-binding protein [Fervidobacterium gondwanense]SHN69228.1 histidine triad (HIT) family protein [Fervidobacterium gondwanense DSM 13020]
MSDCVFCKIIAGQIPSEKVYEDEEFIVIKDIRPVAPTHLLAIYKKHIPTINDLELEDSQKMWRLFEVIKTVAKQQNIESYRIVQNNGKDSGQEVPHIHFHIIAGRRLGALG